MTGGSERVLRAIRSLLDASGVPYRVVEHQPTRTSAESAAVRGEPLSAGAKALLMKCDDQFRLFVLPADRKADSARVKQLLHLKKLRFATTDELWAATELVPGSVPPFGEPILPFSLFVDPAIQNGPRVAFNAGSLTNSIILATSDYIAIAGPQWLKFSTAEETTQGTQSTHNPPAAAHSSPVEPLPDA